MQAEMNTATPEEAFTRGFEDMALSQFSRRLPELMGEIASFKVIEATPEENRAIGTFVLLRGEEEIHIPAVLADNELMPFDIMYVKSLDVMLPLQEEWLQMIDNLSISAPGEAVKPPSDLRTDEDMRNIMVPPSTGRYSYASANGPADQLLPAYLRMAGEGVKKSFVETLKQFPKMAQQVLELYTPEVLQEALKPVPKASEKVADSTSITFVSIETPASEVKDIFGDNTPDAMRNIAAQGFAAYDTRRDANRVIDLEEPFHLEHPSSAGYYRVYCSDGTMKPALIFTHVKSLEPVGAQKGLAPGTGWPDLRNAKPGMTNAMIAMEAKRIPGETTPRLGVFEDGKMFFMRRPMLAEQLAPEAVPAGLKAKVTTSMPGSPRNGQRGFFYDPDPADLTAVEPIKIDYVINRAEDETQHVYGTAYDSEKKVCIIRAKNAKIRHVRVVETRRDSSGVYFQDAIPRGFRTGAETSNDLNARKNELDVIVMIPWHWKFQPITEVVEPSCILSNPRAIHGLFEANLQKTGAQRLDVKQASAADGLLWLDDRWQTEREAIETLAITRHLRVPDAQYVVKTAMQAGKGVFYVASPVQTLLFQKMLKIAQGAPVGAYGGNAPPPEQAQGMGGELPIDPMTGYPYDPNTGEVYDPNTGQVIGTMQQEGQEMPIGEPMPSAVEIAAQEVAEQLMGANDKLIEQMMQQQQNVQTQLNAVSMVMQRAMQIAEETGLPMPEMAMDPSMMGEPSMMAGMPGGSDQDPYTHVGPGGSAGDFGTGMAVEEPQAMETAANMMDPDLFDAAAISQLAVQNDFDSTVANFLPALRTALDNLGRLLLEFRMRSAELRPNLSDGTYNQMRDRLETLFNELGAALIDLGELSFNEPQPQ